ncbi:MAG: long-chain fatty acid--CoA ligase [Actinomycetota bacterium]
MATRSYDWIGHHAAIRGDQLAMTDLATDRTFTYAEMNERTTRLASALAADFGVTVGERVAVLANNNTNCFEVQFACWKLGAIFVPLNWRLALPELEYIVGDCSPRVIIHDNDFAENSAKLAATCGIAHRITWEDGDADAAAYEEVLASARAEIEGYPSTHDTPLTIMYTSGTTGRPKGATITQGMTFWNAVNCVEFYSLHSNMVNLAFLPLFHTGGLNVFANPAFHFGGYNVVMRSFEPSAALALLTDPDLGVTHFIGVPANYLFMSQVPEFADATFPTIEAASVGGSPTPEPLIRTWAAVGLPLQQAYGMTETSPLVLALKAEDAAVKIGSAGLPAMHTEVRIVDDTGNDVDANVNGELWVRGPNITPGYWNRPDANESSFEDGWLKTGDAARRDDDGFFYIVDRWKDMYISGGENVYPAEVESVIYQLDAIGEVAIIGVPDEKWVEVGRAIVVMKPGHEIDEATIINHCRTNLARYKVPQSVVFIDEIPHNATGKVLKRELREHYGS